MVIFHGGRSRDRIVRLGSDYTTASLLMFIDRCGTAALRWNPLHRTQNAKPKPISVPMWKHIFIVLLIAASVFASAHLKRVPAGPAAEFRCRLPDIVCDACRGAVTAELKKEPGIRDVHFEGEDRKELVVTHSAQRTPASLRASLARIGYPPEVLDGDPSKAVSHQKCVCPVERAKQQQ